jgi:hypothetical protein
MTNYQNGKIYKIEPLNGEEGDVYIGSTCKQYLSQRMDRHRTDYRAWKKKNESHVTSYHLFEKYGVKNCIIVLLETSPCNTRDELFAREAFYIKSMNCVNKYIPLRTNKEYREDNREIISEKGKEYYQDNKDKICEKGKEYYKINKDKISEKHSKYYYDNKEQRKQTYFKINKDKLSEKARIYYQENKEKNEQITCECGSICRRSGILRHKKTIKHKEYEKSI